MHEPTLTAALSVSELNQQARLLLERRFSMIQVEGELSSLSRPSSGHWYFLLKDAEAQVRCAMFSNRTRFLRQIPREGERVRITARVSLYTARGEFQLICEQLQRIGDGALQAAFEALKHKLHTEGLFDAAHKRSLPAFPQRIGVITSPSGAAIHDILQVLHRRAPGVEILLYPCAVQGREAPDQIVAAIALANRHAQCDLLIVGRGGGSAEDLACFNDEQVARAVYNSALPVISAVGHESDISISDLCADLRAPTPSVAAELASPDQFALAQQAHGLLSRLKQSVLQRLAHQQERLRLLQKTLRHPGTRLREQSQRLDEVDLRLQRALNLQLTSRRQHLQSLSQRVQHLQPLGQIQRQRDHSAQCLSLLQKSLHYCLQRARHDLHTQTALLQQVSPLATLGRGYSILLDAQGKAVTTASQVSPGDQIQARLHRGSLTCTVSGTHQPSSQGEI